MKIENQYCTYTVVYAYVYMRFQDLQASFPKYRAALIWHLEALFLLRLTCADWLDVPYVGIAPVEWGESLGCWRRQAVTSPVRGWTNELRPVEAVDEGGPIDRNYCWNPSCGTTAPFMDFVLVPALSPLSLRIQKTQYIFGATGEVDWFKEPNLFHLGLDRPKGAGEFPAARLVGPNKARVFAVQRCFKPEGNHTQSQRITHTW